MSVGEWIVLARRMLDGHEMGMAMPRRSKRGKGQHVPMCTCGIEIQSGINGRNHLGSHRLGGGSAPPARKGPVREA